ncbi:MAG: hypothetical protein E7361_03200 [Clostridiales bacterium]|nr:hypothetical protein [Clostridiales bacterium]
MNIVWTIILIVSLIVMLVVDPENAFNTMLSGSEQALNLSIKLLAVYALWLGILQIIEDTGLDKVFAKWLNPIIRWLFPNVDEYTSGQIAINLTSNLLGMGNACTPSGINAIAGMYKGGKVINSNMALLVVLNTTNIQLIPTTIIGIRILHNSVMASSIIIPTIITSAVSVVFGVLMAKLCAKISRKGEAE